MILAGMDNRIAALWNAANGHLLRTFHTGSPVTSVAISPDGTWVLAGAGNQILQWDIAPSEEQVRQLISWTYSNRYIRELTCGERLLYQVEPLCSKEGTFPSKTP
jgi:WD40 repeat protein